jgi:predicted DNA repair protein MutK
MGGVGAWLTNTAASAALGLLVGAAIVAVKHRGAGGNRR